MSAASRAAVSNRRSRDLVEAVGASLALGLPHERGAPALRAAVHLVEQVLLAAEVAIDRAFGHARPRRDGGRGRGAEADGGIQLECCTKQPLAGGLTVAARRLSGSHLTK